MTEDQALGLILKELSKPDPYEGDIYIDRRDTPGGRTEPQAWGPYY